MNVEILTRDDLQAFRVQLLEDLKKVMLSGREGNSAWLRSGEVKKLLNISSGTLQNLRVSGKLKFTKIGSIHFYSYGDIQGLLEKGQ